MAGIEDRESVSGGPSESPPLQVSHRDEVDELVGASRKQAVENLFRQGEIFNGLLGRGEYPFGEDALSSERAIFSSLYAPDGRDRELNARLLGSTINNYLPANVDAKTRSVLLKLFPADARHLMSPRAFLEHYFMKKSSHPDRLAAIADDLRKTTLPKLMNHPLYEPLVRLIQFPPTDDSYEFCRMMAMKHLTFWKEGPMEAEEARIFLMNLRDALVDADSMEDAINTMFNGKQQDSTSPSYLKPDHFFVSEQDDSLGSVLPVYPQLISLAIHAARLVKDDREKALLTIFANFMSRTSQDGWERKTIAHEGERVNLFGILKQFANDLHAHVRDVVEENQIAVNLNTKWGIYLSNVAILFNSQNVFDDLLPKLAEPLTGWMTLQRVVRNHALTDILQKAGFETFDDELSSSEDNLDTREFLRSFLWNANTRLTLIKVSADTGRPSLVTFPALTLKKT